MPYTKKTKEGRRKIREYNLKRVKSGYFKEYCRKWRKLNPDYQKNYIKKNPFIRYKNTVRFLSNLAITCGFISKDTMCKVCGESKKLEMHHPDYMKPLEVVWLCRNCHAKQRIF